MRRIFPGLLTYFLFNALILTAYATTAMAQTNSGEVRTTSRAADEQHDGQHDFDWDIGTWKIHQRRLIHPLSGSTNWVEYTGTDVVQKLWDGANTGRIESEGPAGHLELFTIRIYNPDAHQWNIYFTNSASGTLSVPAIGDFKNGRGEFYDQETFKGKSILVRFRVSDITPDSCSFDQAFSPDGGKTWETNFVVTETRVKSAS
jgi:hypothetical protein